MMGNPNYYRLVASFGILCTLFASVGRCQPAQIVRSDRGEVEVRGNEIFRDGKRWIAHGYYQIAFEVAPGNFSRAEKAFWATAYNNYTPAEYTEMRASGADSVRIQIAQAGADPQSELYDREYFEKALGAIRSARAAGLTVMVCVQDESHVKGITPIDFPDDGTRRVWQILAPKFAEDRGVMYELLNEPRPQPSPENWIKWKAAMMQTLNEVRRLGARNVIIADGLSLGNVIDGAPLLNDSQVVYSAHPYAQRAFGQTRQAWDQKFGNFSRRAPVIITEWIAGSYYCDADTPISTVEFIKYLEQHGIGLEIGVWDWAPTTFGSARQGFPQGRSSSYLDGLCHKPYFGAGKTVDVWFQTGVPANTPQ